MNANVSSASRFRAAPFYSATKLASWLGHAAFLFAAASLSVWAVYMVANGPGLARLAELQRAQDIQQEDLAFCRKLGIDQASAKFGDCVDGLADVRRRHAERISEPGLL